MAVEYENPTDKRIKKLIARGEPGRMPYSWLYYDLVKNVGITKTFHSCQIPEGLSGTLIKSSTKPRDVVLILFGGSGSEVIESRRLDRHFISTELDKTYFKLIKKRLELGGKVPAKYRLLNRIQRKRIA